MGYEEQLRQAERIVNKLNAAKQPDAANLEWLKAVEADIRVLGALGLIQLVVLALLVLLALAHLGQ